MSRTKLVTWSDPHKDGGTIFRITLKGETAPGEFKDRLIDVAVHEKALALGKAEITEAKKRPDPEVVQAVLGFLAACSE